MIKESQSNEALREIIERLTALVAVNNQIATSAFVAVEILELIVKRTQLLTRATQAIIELRDGSDLRRQYSSGTPLLSALDREMSVVTPADASFKSGEVVHYDDLENEDQKSALETRSSLQVNLAEYKKGGVRSLMIVPLYHQEQPEGVLKVLSTAQGAFNDDDAAILRLMAGLTIVVLLRHREIKVNQALEGERARALKALQKHEEVRRLYAERLERSNAELEQFAYVASHDLQEPLRKIQAFGDRLKSKYSEALGEEGADYIMRMQNAAGRMQTLINDLLSFSRITKRVQPFKMIPLKEVVAEVISDLYIAIEKSGAIIEEGELPTIEADPLQMRQLLQNLIGNALKFHRPDEVPRLKIYARVKEKDDAESSSLSLLQKLTGEAVYEIYIEDNGIGFDEKYLDRIFNVFQRLHGRAEYQGSGIGLAICRKIAERHHGSITARSTIGEGSRFIVTLPIKQPTGEIIL